MVRKKLVKYRGIITHKEIISDLVFLAVSYLVSLLAVYIFNIHWSFYPGEHLFPPSRYVGISSNFFVIIPLIGAIVGFFIIKLLLVGIKEDLENEA